MKALLATKLGMTQLFDEKGRQSSVTLLEAKDCVVTQIKDISTDGYEAIQLGVASSKNIAKPQAGHLKKAKASSRYLKEFRVEQEASDTDAQSKLSVVDKINTDRFEIGDKVRVQAISKGKGFAGTIKRHNFARGPKTHGSHNYRAPGSIGAGYPQHVFKGQKMAGRMGTDTVTVRNLEVIYIDSKNNIIGIKGAIPGPKKGLVRVQGI
ncbi:MAG: large subunit ribosomal protein [Patescibacteria group bacterium]|nr:large subunit ribosomal protein [Patescibacteria group bacterium]